MDAQTKQLITDYIEHTLRGAETDPIQAAAGIRSRYGINVDWHACSDVLDEMNTNGRIEITKPGGMTRYRIPAEPLRRYYLLNRPPWIGTHPDGNIHARTWQPKRQIPEAYGSRTAHGWITCREPLTPAEIWKWELYPADPDERREYNAWREKENR